MDPAPIDPDALTLAAHINGLRDDLRRRAVETLRAIATDPNPGHSESVYAAAVDAIACLIQLTGPDEVLMARAVALTDHNVPARERYRASTLLLSLSDELPDDESEN